MHRDTGVWALVGWVERCTQDVVMYTPPHTIRATTLLLQILHAQSWSPETHVLFPSAFKDAVRMRLLCRGPCEEDAHQEGATHHHAAASVVVCIEDACCQANPSEIEQQQVAWMFARASKEDMMATADMVWPISQWLGPSGKHV